MLVVVGYWVWKLYVCILCLESGIYRQIKQTQEEVHKQVLGCDYDYVSNQIVYSQHLLAIQPFCPPMMFLPFGKDLVLSTLLHICRYLVSKWNVVESTAVQG